MLNSSLKGRIHSKFALEFLGRKYIFVIYSVGKCRHTNFLFSYINQETGFGDRNVFFTFRGSTSD